MMGLIRHPVYIVIEFAVLCVLLPALIVGFRLAPLMFVILWSVFAYCVVIDRLCHPERIADIWKSSAIRDRRNWSPMLVRWVICSLGMVVFMLWYDPGRLFSLFYTRPVLIPVLLVLYPILSAFPQEYIFCHYFFRRYSGLFRGDRALIIASSLTFAFAHMLFINWVAPFFSLIAGVIFARTYAQTRSLGLVSLEHALYGNVLFLVGMGWYFYHGAVAP